MYRCGRCANKLVSLYFFFFFYHDYYFGLQTTPLLFGIMVFCRAVSHAYVVLFSEDDDLAAEREKNKQFNTKQ